MSPMATISATTMLEITQMTPRAEGGTGALAITVDGHWNSRIAGNVGSLASDRRRSSASMFAEALLMAWPDLILHGPAAASPRDADLGCPYDDFAAPIAGDKAGSAPA